MTDIIERLKEPEAHYPGNFDTPKRANAMLSCLCQEAMEEIESLRQRLKHITDQYLAALDAERVRYRQVVEKDAEIARLYRDQEQYGPDKVAIEKQAWVEADRQRQINELRKQLAEKEAEIERLKEEQAELIRRFQNENCGQTFMGEPVIQDRPVPAKQYMAAVNGRRAFRSQVIELRQQLAASQAREQQLKSDIAVRDSYVEDLRERERDMFNKLSATQADNALLRDALSKILNIGAVDDRPSWGEMAATAGCALIQPQDTTALSAMIAKAGEVMRERTHSAMLDLKPWDHRGEIIRALPAVTLDDLKD